MPRRGIAAFARAPQRQTGDPMGLGKDVAGTVRGFLGQFQRITVVALAEIGDRQDGLQFVIVHLIEQAAGFGALEQGIGGVIFILPDQPAETLFDILQAAAVGGAQIAIALDREFLPNGIVVTAGGDGGGGFACGPEV